jgi:hypothetical protein
MRRGVALTGAALLLAAATTGHAKVNCKQVLKYLDTGRSAKDIAETMVIEESEVKQCQDEAAAAKAAGGDAKAGEAKPAGDAK